MDKTHQLLQFLSQQPSAPSHFLTTLQAELTNINDIYISYKTIIILAINLLNMDASFDGHSSHNNHLKRSLLPFLGNTLSWLTRTAITKDVNSIKKRVNQLIEEQSTQQETLVHIISILNITWYAAQVNRHSINVIMDKVDETVDDVNNLYNLTTSLATSLSYHQLILHIRSILANLWDSLSYIGTVSMHTMDYINAATTGKLLPHVLPIMDPRKMLSHIEETLPPTLHLPVSFEYTLHFCQYLHTHLLIANKQFLLLIDVPIQDQSQQFSIHKIFTLDIPHGNSTAHYDINTQYLGITQDETMAVEISPHQFSICQEANRQVCNIITLFQLLANLLSCITALYTKNAASISARCSLKIRKIHSISIPSKIAPNVWIFTIAPSAVPKAITLICPGETTKYIPIMKPIHILQLPLACSATSPKFHLPPCYESSPLEVNISLDMVNLNTINISSLDFCIWQHLEKHQNESQLQHLATIPSVPVDQLYRHMTNGIQHITPFTSPEESTGDTALIWRLFSYTRVYAVAIGLLIPAGLGIFCCYFFWC